MSAHAPQHDAQKALADLRDHLARHDKPIAFFFGAGTSCAVAVPDGGQQSKPLIPAVAGLTLAPETERVAEFAASPPDTRSVQVLQGVWRL